MPTSKVKVVYLSSLDCPHTWEESCDFVKQWCKDNKASFYSVPAEDFYVTGAINQAMSEGNSVVLVDSLS